MLGIEPEGQNIVLTEPSLNSIKNRQDLFGYMFETFKIENLFFETYKTIYNGNIKTNCNLNENAIPKNIKDLVYFSLSKNIKDMIINDV